MFSVSFFLFLNIALVMKITIKIPFLREVSPDVVCVQNCERIGEMMVITRRQTNEERPGLNVYRL